MIIAQKIIFTNIFVDKIIYVKYNVCESKKRR